MPLAAIGLEHPFVYVVQRAVQGRRVDTYVDVGVALELSQMADRRLNPG